MLPQHRGLPTPDPDPGLAALAAGGACVDVTRPHPARVYDSWLGGKTNFEADRQAAQAIAAQLPAVPAAARANRAFLQRAVRFLAQQGVEQFLDVGTGIPTSPNVHEVAQAVNPAVRVVYADNDPIVLAHARALLHGHPAGRTAYLQADLRDPEAILAHPVLAATLDLSRPVGLLLVAVLHFLTDADDPWRVVARLLAALPSGSWLVASHATADGADPRAVAAALAAGARAGYGISLRERAAVARFFDGLVLAEPGLVPVAAWRPDHPVALLRTPEVLAWAGAGRKP